MVEGCAVVELGVAGGALGSADHWGCHRDDRVRASLISTPILLLVYDPKTVIFLTAVFSVFINAAVVLDSWREAHRTLALALLVPACVGIVAGAEVLRVVDRAYIRLAVGAVVVFSALLLVRDSRLPGADTR